MPIPWIIHQLIPDIYDIAIASIWCKSGLPEKPIGLWVFLFGRISIAQTVPGPGQKGYVFLSVFGVIGVVYGICLAVYLYIDILKGLEARREAKKTKGWGGTSERQQVLLGWRQAMDS
jgi:hypothetical protein